MQIVNISDKTSLPFNRPHTDVSCDLELDPTYRVCIDILRMYKNEHSRSTVSQVRARTDIYITLHYNSRLVYANILDKIVQ